MTRRELQAARTKQKIQETAKRLIAERGYDQVTIRDIASECGIALGTMYHYYSGKAELMEYFDKDHYQPIFEEALANDQLDGIEKLTYYISEMCRKVQFIPVNYSRQWHKLAVEQKIYYGPDSQSLMIDHEQYALTFLQLAVSQGLLREDTPVRILASNIIFNLYGAGLKRCTDYEIFDYQEWCKDFVNVIIPSLLAPFMALPDESLSKWQCCPAVS